MTIDDGNDIPRDLEPLHEELLGMRIEERPSFAPELESELRAAHVAEYSVRRHQSRVRRGLVAASIVGLLALGAVPQARGALSRVLDTVRSPSTETVAERAPTEAVTPVAGPTAQFVPFEEAETEEAPPREPVTTAVWSSAGIDEIRPTFAYPELRNPAEAERIVALHYPSRLQEQRIGGNVRVLLWVDERGVVQDRQIVEGSGVPALDRAALSATGRLRFDPARRQGDPVGSWVKFNIRFQPPAPTGVLQPRITEDVVEGVDAATRRAADSSGAHIPD